MCHIQEKSDDHEKENESGNIPQSPAVGITETPVSLVVKKPVQRLRRSDTDSVLQQLCKNAENISKMICETPADPSEKFLGYLGEQLKLVPTESRRKCEQGLLLLVNSYVDGTPFELVSTVEITDENE